MRNVGCLLCKLVGLTRVKRPGLPMESFLLNSWWRHQLETFSVLLAIYEGNSLVISEFPSQRLGTQSFQVFFDLRPNKQLSKQWSCLCLRHLRAHYDVTVIAPSYVRGTLYLLLVINLVVYLRLLQHYRIIWYFVSVACVLTVSYAY